MVVRVKLKKLKIARNGAGHYYVYVRGTKRTLIKNFAGTREELIERLGAIDVMTVYNATRKQELGRVYADGTLGALIAWFQTDCPAYAALAASTKDDYDKAFAWLESGFDCPLDLITTPELYDLRDRCNKEKWPRFAEDDLGAVLDVRLCRRAQEDATQSLPRYEKGAQGRSERQPRVATARMGIRSGQRSDGDADPLHGRPLRRTCWSDNRRAERKAVPRSSADR